MRERYFSWVLDHPWLTIFLSLVVMAALSAGLPRLSFSNDYRMFFSEDNPQLQAFEALQDTYSKNDNVLYVITPKQGEVFTADTLDTLAWMTKEAWQTPYSLRVDSVTNYQHTEAEGDDLRVSDLVKDPKDQTAAQLARLRDIAVQEPLLVHRLISPDGKHTGINVTIQLPGEHLGEVPEVTAFSRDLMARAMARDPNLDIHMTGMVIMNNAFPEASQKDMKTLYPLMFGVVLVTMAVMLRSVGGTVSTLTIIVLMVLATMGLSGWLGIRLSPPTTSVPVVIMTLAVADCVHILSNFLQGFFKHGNRHAAMLESLRINLTPVFLTTFTTAVGFMSLNFSDAPPFRDLGNMSAMGVTIAFFLSITLLPAMMMVLPLKRPKHPARGGKSMPWLANFVVKHRNPLFWGMATLAVLLVAQVPRNTLNDEFVEYFSEDNPFRAATTYATDHLTGIYLIEYSLPAESDGGISDPKYLQHLDDFANWYRAQPQVLHVNVLTDIMKRLNKNLHGDDPSWYRLPDDRELSAQYLLLYEFSLPFGLDLNNQIDVRKSATRMVVTLENLSSTELLAMEQKAQAWLAANAPAYMQTHGASPSMMFANIGQRNIVSMLKGTTIALMVISGVLVIALRSWRLGLLSLIPNLLPIAMGYGIWSLVNGQIGLALSVVSGMTLGIVVDDTVHFLSKYLRARREQGLDAEEAVRYAFSTVGSALWVTSLVLILGFGVLAFSDFVMNAQTGALTAITIGLALLADFLFLPPLLMKFGDKKNAKVAAVDHA